MKNKKWILAVIVLSQFCCTSLWFAGNAVMNDLVKTFHFNNSALGHLTSAVQFGFIAGTLAFAMLTIADRFSPSKVFFTSALIGAIFNLATIIESNTLTSLLVLRFITGFCLAGIYPVGMKIAADYFQKELSKSLGLLVGALVVGTGFPHLIKGFSNELPWRFVLISTSLLAIVGGFLLLYFVPDGPYRKPGQKAKLSAFFLVFKNPEFRAASFGYFGHMWELYAFWTFVPVMITTYAKHHKPLNLNVPIISFAIFALGAIACILGGYISQRVGVKRTAGYALSLSLLCCLLSPLMLTSNSIRTFITFLLFWGLVVIADSPLFSTLMAHNAQTELRGTALTIVNCVGFSITIISIQLISVLQDSFNPQFIYLTLAIGPMFGLLALFKPKTILPISK